MLYLIDTLRADRIGTSAHSQPLTPHLDAFAREAHNYVDAVGQSSWTKPSVASMFTGVWPPAHGAIGWEDKMPGEFDTLAERLRGAGYRTAAFVTNPNITPTFGFDQGFDEFVVDIDAPSARVQDEVTQWLSTQDQEPFFLYIHTLDPHVPYDPPEPFRSRFAPQAPARASTAVERRKRHSLPVARELYNGEIAANDASFGRLIDLLRDSDLYDDALVLVISDHGEEFKEHGQTGHGKNLHAETLDFPWLIKFPGQVEGDTIEWTVQHIDLLPTVLANAGLPTDGLPGRNLAMPDSGRSIAYAHLELGDRPLAHTVVDGAWKLIRTQRPRGMQSELFHRFDDPREQNDMAARMPVHTAALGALLLGQLERTVRSTPAEKTVLDPETERALRALGYLQ